MVLWLKPMVSWRNRGPSVCAHTWLCCSARAGITVSSCNPLWDYVNALSWHNLFLLREIVIGASSVVVSRLMTYGAAAKLRASCECAHRTVLLVGCGYRGLWSWSTVELHWCVIFRKHFPWNNFYVVCRVIKQHLSSLLDQKGIPLSCVVSFPWLWWWLHTYTFPLHPLCSGEALSFLVLRDNWLALKMEICFPRCWSAGVCSFSLLFNPCIPEPSPFISHEETDEQPKQMDFCPSAWSTVSMSKLSIIGLPMVLRGLAQC
jgi:hypothetical protein